MKASRPLICFKGDTVKTKAGDIGEVIDTWGVARDWCKLRTEDGRIVSTMTNDIDSIVKRHREKGKWG